ncbi:MAG TPA: regulatory iron-sulfur-containing complex subunit RicT [Spirochaetia bacterium]|nr:regulatory iron-sulfur-containing complex subunit RicT [Spirochaetia bacterium]
MSDEEKDLNLEREDFVEDDEGVEAESGPEAPPVSGEPVATADGRPAWRVKVLYSSATEYCDAPAGMELSAGAIVVVPTRYGNELARVLGRETEVLVPGQELRSILRIAGPAELARTDENDMREERAYGLCREKIDARGLDMKLVSAHYLLDEQKILFLFTAENRVDFRELVKDLVAAFKMRIELRQIGVRDEARVVGGLGICGRALCCNAVTDRLRPVSIKMAKEQNLTLNSMKISGPCGRLLCCLSYEFDAYKEARHALPGMGTRVQFEEEEFRVVDLNVLARRVRFQSESGRVLDLGFDSLSRNPATQAWEIRARTVPTAPGAAPAEN